MSVTVSRSYSEQWTSLMRGMQERTNDTHYNERSLYTKDSVGSEVWVITHEKCSYELLKPWRLSFP